MSVPCSSFFKNVTVRCGHCTNLLSVNIILPTAANQLHLPHSFFSPHNLLVCMLLLYMSLFFSIVCVNLFCNVIGKSILFFRMRFGIIHQVCWWINKLTQMNHSCQSEEELMKFQSHQSQTDVRFKKKKNLNSKKNNMQV